MRPFEIALLLVELLALMALVLPFRPIRRLFPPLALTAVVLAVVQAAIEGGRWQMTPGYGLAAVFALLALMRGGNLPRRASLPARVAASSGWLVLAAVLLIAAFLPWFVPVFVFPSPDGPYAIGTETFDWVDERRHELFSDNQADRRELMVQVWYPAAPVPGARSDAYVHDADFSAVTSGLAHLPPFLLDHLSLVHTHAVPDAPVARDGVPFPVLLFSPGRGGFRANNTFQIEHLVSHGYVVVGMDQPYTAADVSFPDGRHIMLDKRVIAFKSDGTDGAFDEAVTRQLGEDAVFVLDRVGILAGDNSGDRLAGRLDLDHVGIWGSSLGGQTATEACHFDKRFDACLSLDVNMPDDVVQSPLSQPVMLLVRAPTPNKRHDEGWPPGAADLEARSNRTVFDKAAGDAYLVTISGMFHNDIADLSSYFSQPVAGWLGLSGPLDWHRTHAAINAYSLAFFDRYLRGKASPLLDGSKQPFGEVNLERRSDT